LPSPVAGLAVEMNAAGVVIFNASNIIQLHQEKNTFLTYILSKFDFAALQFV
jgi:hypothetical protein